MSTASKLVVITGRASGWAYQIALAAGGARFDLDGKPCGEVTAGEQEFTKGVVARMDARMIERIAAGKAAQEAQRAAKRAESEAQEKPAPKLTLVPAPETPPKKLSLADLKLAAAERRQARAGGKR